MKFKIMIVICVIVSAAMLSCCSLLQPSGDINSYNNYLYKSENISKDNVGISVKFFGTSTLLLDDGVEQILIDGFFSRPNIWKVAFTKIKSDPKIKYLIKENNMNRVSDILVTHSHYDHVLDVGILGKLLPQANIVGTSSAINIARDSGIQENRLILVQPNKPFYSNLNNFEITAIPSKHSPPTLFNNDLDEDIKTPFIIPERFYNFKPGQVFDYMIEHTKNHKIIMVKASASYDPNQLSTLNKILEDLSNRGRSIDILFLAVGGLGKESASNQNQYLQETLVKFKPKVVVPIHWDNFFISLDNPLVMMPKGMDNTPIAFNKLISKAFFQKTKVIIITTPDPYYLGN